MIHPKYSYLSRVVNDLKKNQSDKDKQISHTMFMGVSGSGKGYLAKSFMEEGLKRGLIKVFNLWCVDWQHLEEAMTFMLPSKETLDKFDKSKFKPYSKPPQFPVRIYIPISNDAPNNIYKGLIVPFTVSMDNLNEDAIKVLCGSIESSGQYAEYMSAVDKGMTLPDLKRIFVESFKGDKISQVKGFMDEKWTQTPFKSNYSTQQILLRRLATLDKEGILAHSQFPYALEKMLKREIKDQQTIVILYLGAIKNNMIRKLVYIYFFETLRQTLEEHGAEKLSYKFVLYHNEIETLVVPTARKDASQIDMAINWYLTNRASTIRHLNGELWCDVKKYDTIDNTTRALFENKYITRLVDEEEIRKIGELYKEGGEKMLRRYFRSLTAGKKTKFRFINLSQKLPMWYNKMKKEMGYELVRPTLCYDGKVVMDYNDFSHINGVPVNKILGTDEDLKISMRDIKKELVELWRNRDEKLLNYLHELKKPKEKAIKEKGNSVLDRIRKYKDLKKENEFITNEEMFKIVDVSKRTFYDDKKIAESMGINL